MNRIFLFLFFSFSTIFLHSQEVSGSWIGNININGTSLRIVFNITNTGSAYESTMDSPDQGAHGIPTTSTEYSNGKLVITAKLLGLHYHGDFKNDSITGIFKQGGISLPLNLKRKSEEVLSRPQTPVEPLPYIKEIVTISSKDNSYAISGTLSIPKKEGVFPAVVLIAGSGPNDRDETIYGHKPFLVISDYLTRNGFAVLRYDKRGVNSSTGNFAEATIKDFAQDASLAVEYLKKREEVDIHRIGLLGHSEGGLIASLVAAENYDISFIILMAAPGVDGVEIVMDQNELSMLHQKFEFETIQKIQTINKRMLNSLTKWKGTDNDSIKLKQNLSNLWDSLPPYIKESIDKESYLNTQYNVMISPGYRSFLSTKPSFYLQKVKCPVLAINGKLDSQVAADKNLNSIKEALSKGGSSTSNIIVYPNLNHLFQESTTGLPNEYGKIEQTISPVVLSDITNWLKQITK